MYLIRLFSSFLFSFFLSAGFTSFFVLLQNTAWNILWLRTQNFDISFFIFFKSFLFDLNGGFSPIIFQWGFPINLYGVISIALFFGFIIASFLRLILPINSKLLFGITGLISLYSIIFYTRIIFGEIVFIASARGFIGLLVFCFIGFLGGILFDFINKKLLKEV
tara:strand:+ start:24288 stop:24779 length:492 start_codon:yes stop_codon:yes gene_type:complete